MKSKILSSLFVWLPFAQTIASSDDDDSFDYEYFAYLDQFQITTASAVMIVGHAIDLAKELGFRYIKILRAEYTLGNQSGDFTCPLEDDSEPGQILTFEDTAFKLVISCFNTRPDDTAYIDIEAVAHIFQFDDEDDDDDDSSFDSDDEDWY